MVWELLKVHIRDFIHKYMLHIHQELSRKETWMQSALGNIYGAELSLATR